VNVGKGNARERRRGEGEDARYRIYGGMLIRGKKRDSGGGGGGGREGEDKSDL